jgi:hypothetical protein
VQDSSALANRGIAPQRKGTACGIQRAVKVCAAGFGQIGYCFAGRRIDDLMDLTVPDINPFAINMELQGRRISV